MYGSYDVGGLAGDNNYGGTISSSYATGSVSGISTIGGLVGENYYGSIINSFYDSETTGKSDTGKGEGKLTTEMQTVSTFTAWDFSLDWYMLSGQYPQLWASIALTPGTNNRTTKLNNVATGMEYSLDGLSYTTIMGTFADNIIVNVGDTIYVHIAATPSSARSLTVDITNIKSDSAIATAAIAGVTAPVRNATPVATIAVT
jgi:hypothetical protein